MRGLLGSFAQSLCDLFIRSSQDAVFMVLRYLTYIQAQGYKGNCLQRQKETQRETERMTHRDRKSLRKWLSSSDLA